jgi:integrase
MPRQSSSHNLTKRCDCVRWTVCQHPWYVETEVRVNGARRRLFRALAECVGREPRDYEDAKVEAQRAIVAFKDGKDAKDLLPGDAPTIAAILDGYTGRPTGSAIDPSQRRKIVETVVHGRPFGDWRAAAVTRVMVEAFRVQRPPVAANRDLSLLRAAFNWAVLSELVPATPFKIGTVPAVRLAREEPRTRRLQLGEEAALVAAASFYLRDLMTAALETGCRLGELLSLQWSQVGIDLFLPAGKTKAKKPRRVPISSVLRAVLERRRLDPAGAVLTPAAYAFGDEIGRPRVDIKTAWRAAVRRAGIADLNFHDLRREAGSRWMDAGVPLATIQRWLGHANIAQTSTYLAAALGNDAGAMAAFEARRAAVLGPPDPASEGRGGNPTDPLTLGQTGPPQHGPQNGPKNPAGQSWAPGSPMRFEGGTTGHEIDEMANKKGRVH